MADSSYDFTQGSGTTARSTTDGSGNHSPNTVVEFQNGSTQPQPVSSSNPLPVDASGNAVPVTDNGGSLTVDGTVTANLGATDNAVLDDIAAQTTTAAAGFAAEGAALGSGVLLQGDDGTDRKNINVDATTGDVQVDVTNTVTVDGSGVTQPVSGTVTANLSATDNAVLDDIAAQTTTTAAAVATEGSALGSGVLIQGDDGTDRTNILVDTDGHLQVDIVGGGGSGGTSATDDAAFTAGSGSGTPAMGFFSADTVDAGDVGVLAMDASRRLLVSIEADNAGIGGGTQYTEGATDASITGTAILHEGAADTLQTVSSSNPLPVDASGNAVPVTDNGGSLTVDGTVGVSGTVTVDGSGVTQPVSASSLPLPTGASTAANQSTANASLSNIEAAVAAEGAALGSGVLLQGDDGTDRTNVLVDTDGHLQVDVLSGGGSGTEYTEGAADASITGTAILWEDAADTLRAVSAAKPLPVDVTNTTVAVTDNGGSLTVDGTVGVSGTVTVDGSGVTQPVSGTVTANLSAIDNAVLDSIDAAVNGTLTVGSHAVTNAGTFAVQSTLQTGSNTIGKLAANSGVDIGDVDVTSQPARDRLTDNIGVALQTDAILNDTTACTPQFAVIAASSSGDNTLVAAVTAKKIRVLSYSLVAAGTVTVRFESGASGTALTGQMSLVANTGISVAFNPCGHFETGTNTLLNLELSGAVSVAGHLCYIEV